MTTPYRAEFVAAIWCFLLAAAAGVVMRFVGVGFTLPEHVDFSNLRRAHSHLMLFAWVTPALGALIAGYAGQRRVFRWSLRAMLVLGLLSFPAFLMWGYGPAEIGAARVPISVIISTASMFAWYAFAAEWMRVRGAVRDRVGGLATRCWDAALLLLVVCSLGAWARGALIGMKVDDRFLENAVIEFFLSGFADGFLLLGTLGIVLATGRSVSTWPTKIAITVLAAATPFEFLALLDVALVPAGLRIIGAGGVAVCSLAALVVAWQLRTRLAGILLALLAAGKLLLIDPATASEVIALGLRIPYLHVLLLGLVSLTLLEVGAVKWPEHFRAAPLRTAIFVSLVALLATTGLWPDALSREAGLLLTAITALFPIFAVACSLDRTEPCPR